MLISSQGRYDHFDTAPPIFNQFPDQNTTISLFGPIFAATYPFRLRKDVSYRIPYFCHVVNIAAHEKLLYNENSIFKSGKGGRL